VTFRSLLTVQESAVSDIVYLRDVLVTLQDCRFILVRGPISDLTPGSFYEAGAAAVLAIPMDATLHISHSASCGRYEHKSGEAEAPSKQDRFTKRRQSAKR
jgi:hypothetical protein